MLHDVMLSYCDVISFKHKKNEKMKLFTIALCERRDLVHSSVRVRAFRDLFGRRIGERGDLEARKRTNDV
jgi:hypothetical protein